VLEIECDRSFAVGCFGDYNHVYFLADDCRYSSPY